MALLNWFIQYALHTTSLFFRAPAEIGRPIELRTLNVFPCCVVKPVALAAGCKAQSKV